MPYQSTKTFGHDLGLSCAFRQWRSASHCQLIHGYALSFKIVFEAQTLDEKNWVVDFGSLKSLKEKLQSQFDHTLLVAEDDPKKEFILALHEQGLANVIVVQATGCEATAKYVFDMTSQWLKDVGHGDRVKVVSVEVREHGANSGLYIES